MKRKCPGWHGMRRRVLRELDRRTYDIHSKGHVIAVIREPVDGYLGHATEGSAWPGVNRAAGSGADSRTRC